MGDQAALQAASWCFDGPGSRGVAPGYVQLWSDEESRRRGRNRDRYRRGSLPLATRVCQRHFERALYSAVLEMTVDFVSFLRNRRTAEYPTAERRRKRICHGSELRHSEIMICQSEVLVDEARDKATKLCDPKSPIPHPAPTRLTAGAGGDRWPGCNRIPSGRRGRGGSRSRSPSRTRPP